MEYLILLVLLAMPVVSYLERDSVKQSVLTGKRSRTSVYQQTIVYLWLPTLLLGWVIYSKPIRMSDVGLSFAGIGPTILGFGLVALMAVYSGYCLSQIKKSQQTRESVLQAMQTVSWLMPISRSEHKWFCLGVSTTAGICEELLFRGFLLYFFTPLVGFWGAVIISSIMFGACHLYLGRSHVLRTALCGAVLALVYWLTGSIWFVVTLHAMMDVHAGNLFYFSQRKAQAA